MVPGNMEDLSGKIIMVTGATSGIGEETALELARRRATIILVGRSQARCEAAAARIKQDTGSSMVEYLVADLSSNAAIHQVARQFLDKHDRLDVLVNNAGSVFLIRRLSVDGIEMTFALNHMNYFILTLLLLEALKKSPAARIVNVSSNSHRGQRLDFDDLQLKKSYNVMKAYGRSKFANVLFTYELARRLVNFPITVNALHPGRVATRIWNKGGILNPLISVVMRSMAIPVEEGAKTVIYLASSPEVEGISGKYFTNCKAVPSDRATYDEAVAKRLWDASLQLSGLNDPTI